MELEPTNWIRINKKAFPIPAYIDCYAVFIVGIHPHTYTPLHQSIIDLQGH
jgi:hypothetical protein